MQAIIAFIASDLRAIVAWPGGGYILLPSWRSLYGNFYLMEHCFSSSGEWPAVASRTREFMPQPPTPCRPTLAERPRQEALFIAAPANCVFELRFSCVFWVTHVPSRSSEEVPKVKGWKSGGRDAHVERKEAHGGGQVEGGRNTDWKKLRLSCMFTFFMHFTLRGKLLSLPQ